MSDAVNLFSATVTPGGGGRFAAGGQPALPEAPVSAGAGGQRQAAATAQAQGAGAQEQQQAQDPDAEAQQLAKAVEDLKKYVEKSGADLSIRVDDDTGRMVVTLVDRKDGKVLRQIPGEEALRISRALAEFMDSHSPLVDAVA